jgi:hypothetical protein
MATFRGVKFKERPGSPDESYSNGQAVIRRTFDVAWSDRWKFITSMIGFPINLVTPLQRETPPSYPVETFNGSNWLFPVALDKCEGVGPPFSDGDIARYQFARVTIRYESLTYKVAEDEASGDEGGSGVPSRFVTKTSQPSAEYLTLPQGGFKWENSNVPVTGGRGQIVPSSLINYTWHQVPALPDAVTSGKYVGTVNDAIFDKYAKGTLLCTGIDSKPYRAINGMLVYDVTFRLKYYEPQGNGKGHNYFFRYTGANLTFEKLTIGGNIGGVTVYPKQDFSKLFSIGGGVAAPDPNGT